VLINIFYFFWLDPKETKDQGLRKTEALSQPPLGKIKAVKNQCEKRYLVTSKPHIFPSSLLVCYARASVFRMP
jgi:hypothetical protein